MNTMSGSKNKVAKKLWNKGSVVLDQSIELFETQDDLKLDQRLVKYDVLASIAHAKMLSKIGILTNSEFKQLSRGLNKILDLDKHGQFELNQGDEDVHTKIEGFLTENYGEVGKKIHTARSRNDQVLTAIRLYSRDRLILIEKAVTGLMISLKEINKKYGKLTMPGYTHMQKAMPSSVGMWVTSFVESLQDDLTIIKLASKINNQSPLGSAAGYGLPIYVDRQYTAKLLGFDKVQKNPIYCQNSRGKIEATILSSLISCLSTVNKLASDILLFTTSEFGFFKIDSNLLSGSSIMPQKHNLDLAELVRSKVHVVMGNYVQIVSTASNLISGYNRDLQDTKKPLFESLDISENVLKVTNKLIKGMVPVKARLKNAMTEELFATEKSLLLVSQGMSFRDAYKKVGQNYITNNKGEKK